MFMNPKALAYQYFKGFFSTGTHLLYCFFFRFTPLFCCRSVKVQQLFVRLKALMLLGFRDSVVCCLLLLFL